MNQCLIPFILGNLSLIVWFDLYLIPSDRAALVLSLSGLHNV